MNKMTKVFIVLVLGMIISLYFRPAHSQEVTVEPGLKFGWVETSDIKDVQMLLRSVGDKDNRSFAGTGVCSSPLWNLYYGKRWISDFVRMKDIARGRPGWLKIPALEETNPPDTKEFDKEVRACTRCDLHKTCKAPVPPSIGSHNIMILGEAPGEDEDREGQGYIGRAGIELWKELGRVGIKREHCIVANTVACKPPNNKIPNILLINRCPWSRFVIETFKPKFILATGNAALYYFKRLKSGITSFNGKTEWDNQAASWVTYSMHPASVLYEPKNRELFREAIEAFAKVISNFS